MELRPYQQDMVNAVRGSYGRGKKRPLLAMPTGSGKCLAKGTPVLLHSGHIRKVEDITVGDWLMGIDGKPRIVKSLARGREMMYQIKPKKGDPFTCNESHILSLKRTPYRKGAEVKLVNISVKDYLDSSKSFKHLHKLWRTNVSFEGKYPLHLPPYILGLWLGDGHKLGPRITTADDEIKQEWINYGLKNNYRIVENYNSVNSVNVHLVEGISGMKGGRFNNLLKHYGLYMNKHIPHEYKVSSDEDRLELLAGLIDTDGYYSGRDFEIVQKNEQLANDIAFVARSLGFLCTVKPTKKKCHNNGVIGDYFRLRINGDIDKIPTRLPRKKANPRKINKNHLMHGFDVVPVGVDDYYGFELEGEDRLFLLGDFTVTHNTVTFAYIAKNAVAKGNKVLILAHRKELIKQAVNKISDMGVDAGVIAPWYQFNPMMPVQVASVQTLVRRLSNPWRPNLIVVDESHHACSATYTNIINHYADAKVLGVTATPCRSDGRGLGDVFDDLILGPSMADLIGMGFLCGYDAYAPPIDVDFDSLGTQAGDFKKSDVEKVMTGKKIIGDAVKHYRQYCDGQPAIVFCVSVRHAEYTAGVFKDAGYNFVALSGETPAEYRDWAIQALGTGQIQGITSCDIISEGTDIPVVKAAIMLRPTMSEGLYLQQVGRVLRPAEGKGNAVILDHAGNILRHGLPDDDRDWQLEKTKPKKRKKAAVSDELKVCEKCYTPNIKQARVCARCGNAFTIQSRELQEGDGELVKIEKTPPRPKKEVNRLVYQATNLAELRALGQSLGYKPGWAYVQAKRRGFV